MQARNALALWQKQSDCHAPSGVPGGSKWASSSGGVMGANTGGLLGGGPGGVGGVGGGEPGRLEQNNMYVE